MGISMPITKEKMKNHFHYGLWKYVVLIVASIFLWNFLFTTTHYRTPGNLKMEFYAEGFETEETGAAMKALLAKIHEELMPELEEVTYSYLVLDSTYGPVQLTVWASAGQGDVYLLAKEHFLQMAQGGAMLDLQPYIDSGMLHVDGLNLAPGIVREEGTGERVLRGIPADTLTGLGDYGLPVQGCFLSILASSENAEESARFIDYLLTHMPTGEAR